MPKTDYGGMRFVAVRNDLIVGFEETKDRGDDDVERDDNVIRLYRPPLEVVLGSYLNRRGESEGKRDDRFVVCEME